MKKNKVIPKEIDKKDKTPDLKFIQFSRFRNGLLARWICNCLKSKTRFDSSFTYNEILSFIFMFLILIRPMITLTVGDADKRLLMYYGYLWHYLGANRVHSEVIIFLWTLNFLALYLFVIHSPNKHYKWLGIYGFLAVIIPHRRIGIYSKLNNISVLLCSKTYNTLKSF